ncbi:MAG: hypothetical protein ACT4PL_03015 [Phycisphaerales bacterium]
MSEERRKENKFILYTDIVGHTKMFGRLGAPFRPMRERHDELFQQAVQTYAQSAIVQGSGDGFFCAMDDVSAAVEAALMFRRALVTEDWGRFLPPEKRTPDNVIRSRVGLHSGLVNVVYRDGVGRDFDGAPRTLAEKVMSMAVGNQVLLTRQVRDQAVLNVTRRDELDFKKFGEYLLRGVSDTVEVWGIGEADIPIGQRPVQPPEHRVIVFSTIHDFTEMNTKLGPEFEKAKDIWDHAFSAAVEANAKDAFVKRLPDGTLAAFKNALEATRAARDFRRAYKIKTKNAVMRLEPKIALDSGLVTFEYENNRATDVRDQPVNIAAKVCKAGLAAPWQLILSRPVREDAHQNLPERDEFKWVCLGRKNVPGEPEPLELWDVQDIQQKAEQRTLVLADAKRVFDALKLLPAIQLTFNTRLNDLVAEVISRRSEEPWVLPFEGGVGLAFKDPVEAIQCSIDLRDTAMKEQWERILTGFRRASRDDNLLKIAVAGGQVRMTYEDGLIREFKGSALDGARPLTELAEHSQIIVQRELKEAVAAAFPESDVKWRKVEGKQGDKEVDAFELRRGSVRSNRPMLIGAGVLTLVAVVVAGFAIANMSRNAVDTNWKPGERLMVTANPLNKMDEPGYEVLRPVRGAVEPVVQAIEQEQRGKAITSQQFADEIRTVNEGLQKLVDRVKDISPKPFEEHVAALGTVKDRPALERWLGDAAAYMKPTEGGNPIANPAIALRDDDYLDQVGAAIARAAEGESKRTVGSEFSEMRSEIAALRQAPWIERDRAKHENAVRAAQARIDRIVASVSTLPGVSIDFDVKPVALPEAIVAMQNDPSPAMADLARLVARAVRAERSANKAMTDAESEAKAQPAIGLLNEAAKVKDRLRADLLAVEMEALSSRSVTLADVEKFLSEAPLFASMKDDPTSTTEHKGLRERIDTLRRDYLTAGGSDDKINAEIRSLDNDLIGLLSMPTIEKNRAEITSRLERIDAALSSTEGSLASRVAAAKKAAEELLRTAGAAAAEFAKLIERTEVAPAEFSAINEAWRAKVAALRDRRSREAIDALLTEGKVAAEQMTGLADRFKANLPSPDTGISRAVRAAVVARRDAAMRTVLTKSGTDAFGPAADTAAKEFGALADSGTSFGAVATSVAAGLDRAFALDESPSGDGRTLRQLAADVVGHPLYKLPEIAGAFEEYDRRIRTLVAIEKETQPPEILKAVLAATASTPEVIWSAWRRLDDPALIGIPGYLTALHEVQQEIARLPGLVDTTRKEALQAEMKRAKAPRWARAFERQSTADAVKNALTRRDRFGTDQELFEALKPAARYNFRRAELQSLVDGAAGEEDLKRAVGAFAAEPFWASLPPESPARALLIDLTTKLAAGEAVVGGEKPLTELGPASVKGGVWKFVGNDGSPDRAVYEMQPPASGRAFNQEFTSGGPRLTFIRVQAAGQAEASYICTTELPLGVASESVARARSGPAFKATNTQDYEQRGPFVWSRDATNNLRPGEPSGRRIWVPYSTALSVQPYFPPGAEPPAPSIDHPINFVTPRGAVLLTKLIGCRLPSSAEWKAAAAKEPSVTDAAEWNLRDQAFKALIDHRRATKPAGTFDPDAYAFPSRPPAAEAATLDGNDRFVLFAKVNEPVRSPKTFMHLVGNVAEMVYESPAKADKPDVDIVAEPDANGNFRVIGGSAMSRIAESTSVAIPIANVDKDNSPASIRGFADVGLRPAFTAARVTSGGRDVPYAVKLGQVMRNAPYLTVSPNP